MSTSVILWSLIFGSIGLGYFVYGKKKSNVVARYTGVALMIYPYFIQDTLALPLVGVCLKLPPKFIKA